jgi:signal transduction histidine kinase
MNAIIGYAHLLLEGMAGPLSAEQEADVRQIADGGDRLLRLIDDVLDLSRIESGRLELATEPVDVGGVLDAVRVELAPLAAARGLTLEASAPPGLVVPADPQRLRQVVLNLAGNAVKFTERGGVWLEASRGSAGVDIVVADTGIGIAPEALPHVFDEFRQADDGASRRYQGSGLGLAIVRRLVRLHGGVIAVVSEPGAGSTFTVTLPADGVAAGSPNGSATGAGRGGRQAGSG